MKQNQFYRYINIIILLIYLTTLNARVHTPIEDEKNIILMISGKEITYYELDDGLIYDNIVKKYEKMADTDKALSTFMVGLHSMLVKMGYKRFK